MAVDVGMEDMAVVARRKADMDRMEAGKMVMAIGVTAGTTGATAGTTGVTAADGIIRGTGGERLGPSSFTTSVISQ